MKKLITAAAALAVVACTTKAELEDHCRNAYVADCMDSAHFARVIDSGNKYPESKDIARCYGEAEKVCFSRTRRYREYYYTCMFRCDDEAERCMKKCADKASAQIRYEIDGMY